MLLLVTDIQVGKINCIYSPCLDASNLIDFDFLRDDKTSFKSSSTRMFLL